MGREREGIRVVRERGERVGREREGRVCKVCKVRGVYDEG